VTERTSAGELGDRHTTKHEMYDFFDEMKSTMYENLHFKGRSWKSCTKEYLIEKLLRNVKQGHWVDVANYAFMLHDKEEWKP
jgi:acyl-CoA-binding protein